MNSMNQHKYCECEEPAPCEVVGYECDKCHICLLPLNPHTEVEIHVCPIDSDGLCDDCPCHKENPTEGKCACPTSEGLWCGRHTTDYKSNSLKEGWEDNLERIWSRAHIPDFALDAKTTIKALFRSLLTKSLQQQKERIVEELGKMNGVLITKSVNGGAPENYEVLGKERVLQTIKNLK